MGGPRRREVSSHLGVGMGKGNKEMSKSRERGPRLELVRLFLGLLVSLRKD